MIEAHSCLLEILLSPHSELQVQHIKSLASDPVNSRPVKSFRDNRCFESLDEEEMSTPISRNNNDISNRLP